MLGNLGVFSFLCSFTTWLSATSFKTWTFSAFKRLERFFLKSLHIIFIMYIIRSETFIKIDLLQNLEILRQTYPTNWWKIRATTFTVWRYANFSKLMRTMHISMTSTFQCEYCQCLAFKVCNKSKLECASRGSMHSAH